MRFLVLGTAGHIDHGKSALVNALSGTDPDRLAEERRRGITIELGFADYELEADKVVSFVDVPGHERFVRHMVAGATGIDAVLLVIAADQGVQPQTREHMAICTLLGLTRGVVALTKSDLVDEELLEVARMEAQEFLAETFLAEAPIVAVSARSGAGLPELNVALLELFDQIGSRPDGGVARLPVDRSFVMKGFGSVVTGTLLSGRLEEGQSVEILPGGKRGRIRGLHVHHHKVPVASAGVRTAVNLQGLETSEVPRGSTVTHAGSLETTRRIWARMHLLPDAPRGLAHGGRIRFHQGTCERWARFRVLGRDDDGLHVEIYLDEEAVLAPGDRFILRQPAPVDTVGGGTVMEIHPPRSRDATPDAFVAEALDPDAGLLLRLRRAGAAGCEAAELATTLGLQLSKLEERLGELSEARKAGARWIDEAAWFEVEAGTLAGIDAHHRDEPLSPGIAREALRAATSREISQEAWRLLLMGLKEQGKIRLSGERVARADHEVTLVGADRALSERIEAAYRDAALEPPEASEVIPRNEAARARKIVDYLVADGRLIRLPDGKMFHGAAIEGLLAKLADYARSSPTIDVAAFKQLAGITRKNAIPLLEYLDSRRITRRAGNTREFLGAPEAGS